MPEDMQELPPQAARSWMETTPIAGKCWQPSETLLSEEEMKLHITPIKSVLKEGGMKITKLMHDNPKHNGKKTGVCCKKFILLKVGTIENKGNSWRCIAKAR